MFKSEKRRKEASNYQRPPLEGSEDQVLSGPRRKGTRLQRTADDLKSGEEGEEEGACRPSRIIPECEKVLQGQLAAGRRKTFIESVAGTAAAALCSGSSLSL